MKKIGILVNSIGFGGNERSAVNIANAIKKYFNVTIVIQEDCGNHYGYKGRVINLNTPCAKTLFGKGVNALRRIFMLKRIINKERFDSMFIILPVSNPINYLRLKCKKIVSCRDCGDLIRNTDKYIKMTENSNFIVCNSKYQSDYLMNAAPSLKDKSKVIYNILDIDTINILKEQQIDKSAAEFIFGKKCIISTGRFADAKGLNNLLKAFSLVAKKNIDVRLIMIGDGELRGKIEKLINSLNLNSKVLLLGFQDNPFNYIAHSNVYVLPSFFEGFPNTLVEAMACGTPVISTDCLSGPSEILCGNATDQYLITEYGILIPDFPKEETTWNSEDIRPEHMVFANAIETVLYDQELSSRLSANAMIRVNDFTADKISYDWYKLLCSCMV